MTDDAEHRKLFVYISLSYKIQLTLGVELTIQRSVYSCLECTAKKEVRETTQPQNLIFLLPPNDPHHTYSNSGLTKELQ